MDPWNGCCFVRRKKEAACGWISERRQTHDMEKFLKRKDQWLILLLGGLILAVAAMPGGNKSSQKSTVQTISQEETANTQSKARKRSELVQGLGKQKLRLRWRRAESGRWLLTARIPAAASKRAISKSNVPCDQGDSTENCWWQAAAWQNRSNLVLGPALQWLFQGQR